MPAPKTITDTIAALRQERVPLAARLDAVDLAIDNLCRVYGLHGTPQPLPIERRNKPEQRARTTRPVVGEPSEAAVRRDVLLTLIEKAEHGLTAADMRKATPKMEAHDRGNALNALKQAGKVKRAGNTWVTAA